ncbi:oxysterols receptor LXR-alpha-like [Ptychodera flava]|uniref:oxysterols receptor LXR-alpha-like n=1 Tax=Ptychodera flava TaxID=63121 RepID=UPI00396A4E53
MSTKYLSEDDGLKVCVVCGDKANGLHYRVLSCEGCKTFFRRNVRHRDRLKCEMDKQGKCEMDLYTRRQCPACRMQKCLASGMQVARVWTKDRLATRKPITKKQDKSDKDRPVSSLPSPSSSSSSLTSSVSPLASPALSSPPPQTLASKPSTPTSSVQMPPSPETLPCESQPIVEFSQQQKDFIDYITVAFDTARKKISAPMIPKSKGRDPKQNLQTEEKHEDVTEATTDIDSQVKSGGYEPTEVKGQAGSTSQGQLGEGNDGETAKGPSEAMFEHFMEMLIVILKQLIAIARCIPGFSELAYQDQAILIKTSLIENMMLGSSEYHVPEKEGFRNVDNEEIYGKKECEEAGFGKIQESMLAFSKVMSELKLKHSEYCLLIAMTILSPDREGLQDRCKVEKLQQVFVENLLVCTKVNHPHDKILFAKIISKLTQLRNFSEQYTEHILNLQLNGKRLMPLLAELFDLST